MNNGNYRNYVNNKFENTDLNLRLRPDQTRTHKLLTPPCLKCHKLSHSTFFCYKNSLQEKLDMVNEMKICKICFSERHSTEKCLSKYSCKICQGRHSRIICEAKLQKRPVNTVMHTSQDLDEDYLRSVQGLYSINLIQF